MFDLVPHGPDTFVGAGPRYPWGGLYGGQIVAQALRAASDTVDPELLVHSLRAYFIRRGDHAEPVRYEVDRIRNGRMPESTVVQAGRTGAGRTVAWMKVDEGLGDGDPQLLHRCWLAYLSDDLATDAVLRAHPRREALEHDDDRLTASLDHTIWYHRPLRADRWHLHDVSCHAFEGGRGLSIGHVFAADGTHVATFAQELLIRDPALR